MHAALRGTKGSRARRLAGRYNPHHTVILGVEIREDAVLAVTADDDGTITGRGKHDGATESSAVEAVRAALGGGPPPSVVGVAFRDPFENGVPEVVAAVTAAAGVSTTARIITRGCAVALAEHWRGAAARAQHVIALTAADTVHSGMVVSGIPFEGAHGLAGAAAWLALNPVEREDYRRHGSLQAEIGAAGIVRRLVWRIKSGDRSRVLDMAGGDLAAIQVQQIFDAARKGDGVSISVVRDTARYIGMAVANLVAIADPNIVVLGGLIADAADQLLQPSRAEALRRLPKTMAESLIVTASTLGDDGGPLGAARAAMLAR
jgi:predicted NBD/HSP70 family sugar kinase